MPSFGLCLCDAGDSIKELIREEDIIVCQRDVRLARAGYYGHMTHIDSQISRLIQTLGEFGLAENTVVAFVSDHGDMMGDHGLWRKGYPYEASSHVPFILYGAGIAPGTRVDSVVEIRDVMPTLLDVAGVEIPRNWLTCANFPPMRKALKSAMRFFVGETT